METSEYTNCKSEITRLQEILEELREIRKNRPMDEIKGIYHTVCDKMDVLISKIVNQ